MSTPVIASPVSIPVEGGTAKNVSATATIYYRDEFPVSSTVNDGSLAPGAGVALSGTQWFITAPTSESGAVDVFPLHGQAQEFETGLPLDVVTSSPVERTAASFGIAANARELSGLTVSGTSVTSASAAFSAADVGKTFAAYGANGSGVRGQAVVSAYVSPTQITLATPIAAPAISKLQEAVLSSGGNGSATTYNVSLTGVAAGSTLLLASVISATDASYQQVITVADNVGGKWRKVVEQRLLYGIPTMQTLWQCVSSPGGNVTVTVTSVLPANSTAVSLLLQEWAGLGMVDQRSIASGTSTSPAAGSITPQFDGDLVFSMLSVASTAPSASPTSPWTAQNGATWFGISNIAPVAHQVQAAKAAIAAGWTSASQAWGVLAASFRPVAPVVAGIIGTDDTAAVQAAIDWSATQSGGGRITGDGICLIAGPQRPGTVTATNFLGEGTVYSYSGQLLLPAIPQNTATPAKVFEFSGKGLPFGAAFQVTQNNVYPPSPNGLVLFSTATSGYVVDVIPDPNGFVFGIGAFSWLQFNLRRATVRTVFDASGNGPGGLNLLGAACASIHESSIDVAGGPHVLDSIPPSPGRLSNAGAALILPGDQNWALVEFIESNVSGYPKGIVHSEHATIRGMIDNCGASLAPGTLPSLNRTPGAHTSSYHVLVQQTHTTIEPIGSRVLDGRIEIEGPVDSFIDDPNGYVFGRLRVGGIFSAKHTYVRNVASSMHIENLGVPQQMPMGRVAVLDSLLDRATGPNRLGKSTAFGLCDGSYHSWSVAKMEVDATGAYGLPKVGFFHADIRNTPPWISRKISATIKTTPTANRAFAGVLFRCPSTSNPLGIILDAPAQKIKLLTGASLVTLIAEAALTIAANTSYALTVYVQSSSRPSACVTITAYVGGVQALQYTLTPAQAATYLATGFDGIGGVSGSTTDDGASRFTNFRVDPADDLPYANAGTAVLVGGTKAVADTAITANSKVRVWNTLAGGTVGALSVAVNAGTGFTINSTSGTDTSTIYYEVVSY